MTRTMAQLLPEPKIRELRLSTNSAVVERPDHHCGGGLVLLSHTGNTKLSFIGGLSLDTAFDSYPMPADPKPLRTTEIHFEGTDASLSVYLPRCALWPNGAR